MSKLKIRPGYACINLTDKNNFRKFRLKTIEDNDISKIREVIEHNIRLLSETISYNIKNEIYVYRIPADLIPFATNIKMQQILNENEILNTSQIRNEFQQIREWQVEYHLRLSIHANHFLILASPNEQVRNQSIQELQELIKVLEWINGDGIVIHVGGAYGDKVGTLKRFKEIVEDYKQTIDFSKIMVENDDKIYNALDVSLLCRELGIRWVFDFHHERCNPSPEIDLVNLLKAYLPTKYHLSSGIEGAFKPPHADYIFKEDLEALLDILTEVNITEADIIFEAKKKNLSIYEILKPIKEGYWELKETN